MLNPKIVTRKKNEGDYGLFAADIIHKGEFIWQSHKDDSNLYKCLSLKEIDNLPDDQKRIFLHFCYQVDKNLFSGYTDMKDVQTDPANYMNHSCDPNCWYEGETLVARRDIIIDEEISYDYGTDATDRDWGFQCNCRSKNCRGTVKRDDWKKLKPVYGNHFIKYILRDKF